MERKCVFNQIANEYEAIRPSYPDALFKDIIMYSNLKKDHRLLEIGCGTGKATEGFVNLGYEQITCIELGEQLANLTAKKFESVEGVVVTNSSFEEWNSDKKYDLVYCATAFHFINPETGYPKIDHLLKDEGTVALFWTVHLQEYDEIHSQIRELYRTYAPKLDDSNMQTPDMFIRETESQVKQTGLFKEVKVREYKEVYRYTAKEYTALLNTHSKHQQLDEEVRIKLLSEIEEVINNHGGTIEKIQQFALFLGKK